MADDLSRRNEALVRHLLSIRAISQPAVANAFRAVPRHLFLPDLPASQVYQDEAIPTKLEAGRAISSSSQPAMMAIMLEQLELAAGQRVLEIGAGTGYNAALLGQLVGPGGRVVTVDIDADLVAAAKAHLAAAGSANVQVVCADGGEGFAPGAPYDRLILTVGAWDILPAWQQQLAPGGRLVLPLHLAVGPQQSVAFDKTQPGSEPRFISRSARDCGFMPMRGAFAGPEVVSLLGRAPEVSLATPGAPSAAPERIAQWLAGEPARLNTRLMITESESFGTLSLWLGLHAGHALCTLTVEAGPSGRWPSLYQFTGSSPTTMAIGLLAEDSLALLDRGWPDVARASRTPDEPSPFELEVTGYGPRGDQAARHLLRLAAAWDAAGRPPSSRLRLRVYGPDAPYELAQGEVLLQKRWTRLVADWPIQAAANV